MTQQTPIGSGFGASTTASEVIRGIDLSGKVAIVTGGYSGSSASLMMQGKNERRLKQRGGLLHGSPSPSSLRLSFSSSALRKNHLSALPRVW